MSKVTRGEFLGFGAAAAAALTTGCAPGMGDGATASAATADLVVLNARVLTLDDDQPLVEAFAVKNGRITALGSSQDIRNLVGSGTEVIEASGTTVTPGFIDAHSHPSGGGLSALRSVDCNLGSVSAIKAALAERANQTPPGEWVIGYMYDDTKLSEGRALLRTDIDEAVSDHPVHVRHRGGHTAVYNSAAFRVAGVTVNTPDPFGGHFYRADGQLTGKVAERANAVITRHIPSTSTREERQAGVKKIGEMMNAVGLTSVHQTGTNADGYIAYQDARAAGELTFRGYLMARGGAYENLLSSGVKTGFGDEWLKVGSVKFAADGSASERTMRMSTPYVGRPDDYGILTMTQDEIHEAVEAAHRGGWQVAIHANGDVTIEMVLNAYERVQQNWPRNDTRHRIEHCTLVNPSILQRIADGGVIPAPFYTYVHYHGEKWAEYGADKLEWMFAHRSFIDYGIPVAPASDYTPGPFEPLMAIQSMVTRKDFNGDVWGPSQKITVDEALQVCTRNGAYASFEEDLKGTLTAGKLADFVILANDPHDVDPDEIKNIPVVRTVVGGHTVYRA